MRTLTAVVVLLSLAWPCAALAQARGHVDAVQRRGHLSCGVWPEVNGFTAVDASGSYSGFDVDICRAVATVLFGTPDRIRFQHVATIQDFLASPDVDIVSRRLTWSLPRDRQLGIRFGPVTFYDGQGFLVPKRLGISRVSQLDARRVCVTSGSPAEFNLGPAFRVRKLALEQVLLEPSEDIAGAFVRGRCHAYTADVSMLASIRAGFMQPALFDILSETVSKEPLAQVVRESSDLLDVLRWTVYALISAEELGVTSGNLDQMLRSDDPDIQRLLGVVEGNGKTLGLRERWAFDLIKAMGNYGELYERNLGASSAIRLRRGLNQLWTSGGLMWAPPVR